MRQDAAINHIPVVIISTADHARKGISLGAVAVLQKPVTGEELAHVLDSLNLRKDKDAPARVLVVDDEPHAVDTIARALEAHHFHVTCSYGGREALEVARAGAFDLIVLDLLMPEFSGFEVAHALKADPRTADVPVLALTQKNVSAEDRTALQGRVQMIIEKSAFSPEELAREVRRAVAAAKTKDQTHG
jgi:CheY-like chemotaxis protein